MEAYDFSGALLDIAQTLRAIPSQPAAEETSTLAERAGRIGEQAGQIQAMLEQLANTGIAATSDMAALRAATVAGTAAIELAPGARALQDIEAVVGRAAEQHPDLAGRVLAINLDIARAQTAVALGVVGEFTRIGFGGLSIPSTAHTPAVRGDDGTVNSSDLSVLRNIATYHREHERYYTVYKMQEAATLAQEANRLKVVADVWLGHGKPLDQPGVDFTDPRYRAAGCNDLNALSAIPSIGVLFMEGEGEPAELRVMKAKLDAQGTGMAAAGEWLADKMLAAWARESAALFAPGLIDGARARFQVIVTNWRGSRETLLAGQLLTVAVKWLEQLDFTPEKLRADRLNAGSRLRDAAWTIDLAAQVIGRSAVDLAGNDPCWTHYRDRVDAMSSSNNGERL